MYWFIKKKKNRSFANQQNIYQDKQYIPFDTVQGPDAGVLDGNKVGFFFFLLQSFILMTYLVLYCALKIIMLSAPYDRNTVEIVVILHNNLYKNQ